MWHNDKIIDNFYDYIYYIAYNLTGLIMNRWRCCKKSILRNPRSITSDYKQLKPFIICQNCKNIVFAGMP